SRRGDRGGVAGAVLGPGPASGAAGDRPGAPAGREVPLHGARAGRHARLGPGAAGVGRHRVAAPGRWLPHRPGHRRGDPRAGLPVRALRKLLLPAEEAPGVPAHPRRRGAGPLTWGSSRSQLPAVPAEPLSTSSRPEFFRVELGFPSKPGSPGMGVLCDDSPPKLRLFSGIVPKKVVVWMSHRPSARSTSPVAR